MEQFRRRCLDVVCQALKPRKVGDRQELSLRCLVQMVVDFGQRAERDADELRELAIVPPREAFCEVVADRSDSAPHTLAKSLIVPRLCRRRQRQNLASQFVSQLPRRQFSICLRAHAS
ncbi:MAG TPA: hypothetical protein VIC33_14745 [Vicinamibacterales bacterium]